jgi:small subunit ribosomal protein S6
LGTGNAPALPVFPLFRVLGPFRAALSHWAKRGFAPDGGDRRKAVNVPLYEHVFLARQDISQTQVDALTKELSDVITEGGGRIGKVEYWGVKPLAYKIKKNRKAHFSLMNIDAPPSAVAEMERRMRLSQDVIRFLTVRVDAHETEPSIQMRKSDRDDRRDGDRGGPRGERGGFRGGGGGFRGGGGGYRGDRDRGGGGPRRDREGGDGERRRGPREQRDTETQPGTEDEVNRG